MDSIKEQINTYLNNPNNLRMITIILFIIFLFGLGIRHFGGFTILIMLIVSIFMYFITKGFIRAEQSGNRLMMLFFFIVAIIVASTAYGYNNWVENKAQFDKNWSKHKCAPYVLPFAGIQNFNECFMLWLKSPLQIFIAPFVKMFESVLSILTGLMGDIQNIRQMINYMRENLEDVIKDIYERLYDTYARIRYIIVKIMQIFSKLGDIFEDNFNILLYAFYSLASLWNGPVGGTARGVGKVASFFCFDGNTLIDMNDGSQKKIKDIVLGDILDTDNVVDGVLKFDATNVQMYIYKNKIILSESHLLFENGKWIRVNESKFAKKINNYNKKYIYCLLTIDAIIKIDNQLFADYMEVDNIKHKEAIYNHIYRFINGNRRMSVTLDKIDKPKYYHWGFNKNTKILMDNNEEKMIKDIKIGDITKHGKVLAKMKMINNDIEMYKLNDIELSGTNFVKKDNKWNIIQHSDAKYIGKCNKPIYNIITDSNMIEIDGKLFRDFEQDGDENLNNYIDDYIVRSLNLPCNI